MIVVAVVLAIAPWQSLDAGARTTQLEAQAGLPVEARFVAATEGFLGTAYVLNPLGEGEGPDRDPLIRYDGVDCVTMVEQAIALALSDRDDAVLPTLTRLRYEAAPSYAGRLHVMEAQWLPVNVHRGLLEDVTRTYGGPATRTVSKRISSQTWKEKPGASLKLPAEAQVTGEFFVDIVPAERAPAVLAVAPEGLVVVVVRADRPRLVSRITHVGVLVQKPSGPHLRHASRSFKRVVDEPVERYLNRNLEFGAWTVEGVALFRVKDPRPAAEIDGGGPVDLAPPVDAGPASIAVAVVDAGATVALTPASIAAAVVDAGSAVAPAPDARRPCGCGASPLGWSALWLVALVVRRRANRG